MKSLLLSVSLIASLLLFGCGGGNGSVSSPTATTQASPTPSVAANSADAAEPAPEDEKGLSDDFAGTADVTEKKSDIDGAALLTAVRTGQQENFDRMVFQFGGARLPGYHIEYIDKPVRSCGSGEVVPLAGDAWLEIRFYPANAHTEDGKGTIPVRSMAPGHRIVKELKSTCDFEADVSWVAGVSSPNKYRILELTNPTRLVVDVKH